MNPLIDAASVIAITEFLKKLADRAHIVLDGEVIIILGTLVGALLALVQGSDVIQGALVGSAAVGAHTTAKTIAGK